MAVPRSQASPRSCSNATPRPTHARSPRCPCSTNLIQPKSSCGASRKNSLRLSNHRPLSARFGYLSSKSKLGRVFNQRPGIVPHSVRRQENTGRSGPKALKVTGLANLDRPFGGCYIARTASVDPAGHFADIEKTAARSHVLEFHRSGLAHRGSHLP